MRFNGRATTDAQQLTALVAADGTAGGFIKDSEAGQLPATATNDNAAAGKLGEYIENTATGVSLTTTQHKTVTSISLTAGDWDVWGVLVISPAGVISLIVTGITTTDNGNPGNPNGGAAALINLTFPSAAAQVIPTGMKRISLNATTTIYLTVRADFTSTCTAGAGIYARRAR